MFACSIFERLFGCASEEFPGSAAERGATASGAGFSKRRGILNGRDGNGGGSTRGWQREKLLSGNARTH